MISFSVPGIPATKGSARAFVAGGRAVVTNDNKRAKPWASTISLAAREAMGGAVPLDGPLDVAIVFTLPRLKSHTGKRGIKASAPTWQSSKPDIDKLVRCALDALTGVVYLDDARIAMLSARKVYGERPGAEFTIQPIDCTPGNR